MWRQAISVELWDSPFEVVVGLPSAYIAKGRILWLQSKWKEVWECLSVKIYGLIIGY